MNLAGVACLVAMEFGGMFGSNGFLTIVMHLRISTEMRKMDIRIMPVSVIF